MTTGFVQRMCYHPEVQVTPKPKPSAMSRCRCGKNEICPTCGWGSGCHPCNCDGVMLGDFGIQGTPEGET